MIPHTLQIKNFLSYGPEMQIIDFRPYHLIYLSGKNGHGKSALLDAMTWALWGQARKITNAVKPDQGLLRLGATQMVVIFDFELNEQLYRVKREYIKSQAKQLAYLEFGMIDAKGAITPLTDKTIRATQAVIDRTIRLDYESFINSAFLRQGHANEFCRKSPKDRKDILATILGLHQFDQLKRKALERVKEATLQRQSLGAVIHSLNAQKPDAKEIQQQVSSINKQVDALKKQDIETVRKRKEIAQLASVHDERQKEIDQQIFRQQQQQAVYQEQQEKMRVLVKEWRSIHAEQLKMPSYDELATIKKELTATLKQQQMALQKRLAVQATVLKVKEQLQMRERVLENQRAKEQQKLEVAVEHSRFSQQVLQKQIEELNHSIKKLRESLAKQKSFLKEESNKNELSIQLDQFEKRKNLYQQLIAKGNWLKAEQENVAHKKNIAHSDNPSCPLCEQNLSAARRKFLSNRFGKQESLIMHQLNRVTKVIARLKELLVAQHTQIQALQAEASKREMAQKEKESFEAQIKEHENKLTTFIKELALADKKATEYAERLSIFIEKTKETVTNDPEIKEAKLEIHRFEKELNTLSYDETAYIQLQEKIDSIEKQLTQFVALHHELLNQPKRSKEIAASCISLRKQKKELQKSDVLKKQYEKLKEERLLLEKDTQKIEQEIKALQETKEKVREEHGRIKTKQEQIERIEKEHTKHESTIEKLNKEIYDYQIIATAAGKDGIQALLIEQAIPEIEQEANLLLSKLTNNQSHVLIESLRDLKRGGSKETLDINISDPSGIRPYEMFSGGETFRIDFAIRIAISKLLARRAGTSLQTLIVDEGFGSQDEEGLSLIMDAIYKIQDDFEKVIVVSHLPTMRDQFPVHFLVEKGVQGSHITVIEQG